MSKCAARTFLLRANLDVVERAVGVGEHDSVVVLHVKGRHSDHGPPLNVSQHLPTQQAVSQNAASETTVSQLMSVQQIEKDTVMTLVSGKLDTSHALPLFHHGGGGGGNP